MPQAIGVAIAGAFGATVTATTAVAIGMSVIMTGVSVGLTLVSRLLFKPKLNLGADDARFSEVSYPDTDASRAVIYGNARVGGIITFQTVLGSKGEDLWRLYTLSGHAIESIDKLYFDDEEVTLDGSGAATGKYAGFIWVYKRLGAAGETFFTELNAATGLFTSTDRQDGCAKVLIRAKWDADKFPNGYPQKVAFLVKGKKIYDPRTGTTAWSNNPALIFRDYMKDPLYGFAAQDDELDDALINAAANVCDELVNLKAGGTEKRYTCNGAFTTEADPFEVLKGILASMAGRLSNPAGKVGCVAGAWIAPTVQLTDDDFRGGLRVVARHARRELFNGVRGRYRNPNLNWEEDNYPAVQSATYVAQDGNQELWTQLDLPFVTSATQAQRLAKIYLERHRRPLTLTGNYKLKGYQVQPNTVVEITRSRFGWVNKTFEATECSLLADTVEENGEEIPVLGVDLTLRETDAGVYAWNPATDENAPTVHLSVSGYDPATAAPVTGATLASGDANATVVEGIRRPLLKVAWTPPADAYVQSGGYIHFRYREGTGAWKSAGLTRGNDTDYVIGNVEVGKSYTVELVAENSFGARSAAVQTSAHTVTMTASSRLTGLDANGSLISPDYIAGDGQVFARTPIVNGGLLDNGNFEASGIILPPPGWQYAPPGNTIASYETGSPQSGTRSLKIVTTVLFGAIETVKRFKVVPGETWKVEGWARAEGGKDARIQLQFQDAAGLYVGSIQPSTTNSGWTFLTATGVVPANAVIALFQVGCWSSGGGTVYFDNVGTARHVKSDEATFDTSTPLNNQGSVSPVQPFVWGALNRTASTIDLSWSAQSLLRADGSSLNVSAGTKQYTGLSASTTYRLYPYVNVATGTVEFANPSPPPTSPSPTYALQAAQDGRSEIPVVTITTTSSGTSGYIPPDPCPESAERVRLEGRGDVAVLDAEVGEWILGHSFATGADVYRRIVAKSIQECSAWRVVKGHRVSPCEPVWENGWKPAFRCEGATLDMYRGRKVHLTVEADEYDESNFYLVDGESLLSHNRNPDS